MNGEPIPGSSLRFIKANPLDTRLDHLDFGPDWWQTEIADMFQDRPSWAEKKSVFLFLDGEDIVAAARLEFWNRPHPSASSEHRAKYHLVLALGVTAEYQGLKDQTAQRSYAGVILNFIERRGREKEGCVGVSLHVRTANDKARGVYEHYGYTKEGEAFIEDGRETIEMRKRFDDAGA